MPAAQPSAQTQRQQQPDRLADRRLRHRIDQHAQAGDAQRKADGGARVDALVQDEIGHQAAPDRHRVVDDDHPRRVRHELGEGAGDPERHDDEQRGDEDVQPVAAGAGSRGCGPAPSAGSSIVAAPML